MTTTDYLINAVFVLIVFRQARERQLDVRSLVVPLVLVAFVAHNYVHSIPTAGNDLVLVAVLATVGLACGVLSGFATHVRAGIDGVAIARVGWLAGALLIAGISSRMVFAFAVSHGAEPAIGSFSIDRRPRQPADRRHRTGDAARRIDPAGGGGARVDRGGAVKR